MIHFFFKCQFHYMPVFFYISYTYNDDVMLLTSPKLLDFVQVKVNSSTSSFMNVNNIVSNIINDKSNKPDRKHKSDSHTQYVPEIKKVKNKLSKKNRRNSGNIHEDSIFSNNNDNFFNDKSLVKIPSRSYRLNKAKKKLKNSVSITNQSKQNSNNNQDVINVDNSSTVKKVLINTPLTIQELSYKLNIFPAEIITYLFVKKGFSVTINQVIDVPIAQEIALSYDFILLGNEYDYHPEPRLNNELNNSLVKTARSPIITILGHVDHGKTSLLSSILKTNILNKEYGGITQSILAYEVIYTNHNKNHKLIFLDTPGHKAFQSMRIRSAKVTDIVLLVIAADDGLKPQTVEAIKYINDMNLNCIVVINKIDKPEININYVKEELSKNGIFGEEYGGNTMIVEVSALKGYNIELLLNKICLLSEKLNLVTNKNQSAEGTILEAYLDKKQGSIANIVVQNGTLKIGDIIVSSGNYGKIKSIISSTGCKLKSSGPSSIVRILGFSAMPQAGSLFIVVDSERDAKKYCSDFANSNNDILSDSLKILNTRVTVNTNCNKKQFNLIVKADTQGSLEAIIQLLSSISQNKVQINIVFANFGNISSSDIELASTTSSIIMAFNINNTSQINNLIKKYNIVYKNFNIIYDMLDYIENYMLNLLEVEYNKKLIGRATVQTVFNINKGMVAGCVINEGVLKKISYIKVLRKNSIVYEGSLESLKRLKDDVDEVYAQNECGLMCSYNDWEKFDVIDIYELVALEKTL
uniref:Translation initiation factor IF-2, chloroplastic n=1 Tax=Cliftonaea pectinata TaxID=2007206 RepID=A0A1Z1MQ51_9FLOR|nr:translation initiation factor 2 [Cliftonaea pectinata]ARW67989.1 translation initiation factor 2 [Cliftonaea pectinata]